MRTLPCISCSCTNSCCLVLQGYGWSGTPDSIIALDATQTNEPQYSWIGTAYRSQSVTFSTSSRFASAPQLVARNEPLASGQSNNVSPVLSSTLSVGSNSSGYFMQLRAETPVGLYVFVISPAPCLLSRCIPDDIDFPPSSLVSFSPAVDAETNSPTHTNVVVGGFTVRKHSKTQSLRPLQEKITSLTVKLVTQPISGPLVFVHPYYGPLLPITETYELTPRANASYFEYQGTNAYSSGVAAYVTRVWYTNVKVTPPQQTCAGGNTDTWTTGFTVPWYYQRYDPDQSSIYDKFGYSSTATPFGAGFSQTTTVFGGSHAAALQNSNNQPTMPSLPLTLFQTGSWGGQRWANINIYSNGYWHGTERGAQDRFLPPGRDDRYLDSVPGVNITLTLESIAFA